MKTPAWPSGFITNTYTLIVFPNCKINLGLSIINKRHDGYHNLETVFYPLALSDVLEIIPGSKTEPEDGNQITKLANFSTSGLKIDGSNSDNLCLKAYHLLLQDFPQLPAIRMHLHKHIPMGAGLGGGSADGAFVLKLLNGMFALNLSADTLTEYALKLGSDCPFFILNRPGFATGRGEILQPLDLDLSRFTFVLVNAGISIHTGWAFSQLNLSNETSSNPKRNWKDIFHQPIESWRDSLVNDFERPVFEKYPILSLIKNQLYAQGAIYASMSGSGSTIYGIFEKEKIPAKLTGLGDLKLLVASSFNL